MTGREVEAHRGGGIARVLGALRPQRPTAEVLELSEGLLRDEAWARLGEGVRARLDELTGQRIGWWAEEWPEAGPGRVAATVVGRKGLAVATPGTDARGRRASSLSSYLVDPESWRVRRVRGTGGASTAVGGDELAPLEGPVPVAGLSRSTAGCLGNLPEQAQDLLLAPFARQEVLSDGFHYEGWRTRFDVFVLVLAGRDHLAVVTGSRDALLGRPASEAYWDVTCRRAEVVSRTGG